MYNSCWDTVTGLAVARVASIMRPRNVTIHPVQFSCAQAPGIKANANSILAELHVSI